MKILNQDIKNRQFKPVYLLFGEEDFLKKSYKNRLREAIVAEAVEERGGGVSRQKAPVLSSWLESC